MRGDVFYASRMPSEIGRPAFHTRVIARLRALVTGVARLIACSKLVLFLGGQINSLSYLQGTVHPARSYSLYCNILLARRYGMALEREIGGPSKIVPLLSTLASCKPKVVDEWNTCSCCSPRILYPRQSAASYTPWLCCPCSRNSDILFIQTRVPPSSPERSGLPRCNWPR